MSHQKLRVLVSAFACSPLRGSEPGIGWNIVSRLAQYHDVTVLVGDLRDDLACKRELDDWLVRSGPTPGLTFCHVGPDPAILLWERLHRLPGLWPFYYRAYNIWQKRAFALASRLHATQPFDAVHQLTILTYREPGYLWKLGIPFFWGPISGADNVPPAFYTSLWREEWGRVPLRDILNRIQLRTARRPVQAAKAAKLVFGVSPTDLIFLKGPWGANASQLCDTGTDIRYPFRLREKSKDEPLRLVWSGAHVSRKALPILLQALARLPSSNIWRLQILGTGPLTRHWQLMAASLGLEEQLIDWTGGLSKENALNRMQEAHVLIHTGVKEAATTVIMEALSLGLPVVCHDISGMGIVVTDTCGIKVPLVNPKTSIAGFSEAIQLLAGDPASVAKLSKGAITRASEFTWDHIAWKISDAYCKFCGASAPS
jgi:glycosyltransferase involved in cell wall biosynthesis